MYFEYPCDSNLHWNLEAQEFVKGERDPNLRLRPLPNYRPCCSPTSAASCLPGHKDAEEKKDVKMTHAQCKRGHRNSESLERFLAFLDIVWHCMTLRHRDIMTLDCKILQVFQRIGPQFFWPKLCQERDNTSTMVPTTNTCTLYWPWSVPVFLGVFGIDCQIWRHLHWGGGKSSAPPGMSSWNSGALCLHSQRSPGGVPGEWNS